MRKAPTDFYPAQAPNLVASPEQSDSEEDVFKKPKIISKKPPRINLNKNVVADVHTKKIHDIQSIRQQNNK